MHRLIVPNELELQTLTGLPTETLDDVAIAANELRSRGPRTAIVTLGPRGALVVVRRPTHIPGMTVTAADTSGAGDAFCGALAALSRSKGLPMVEAAGLRIGSRR